MKTFLVLVFAFACQAFSLSDTVSTTIVAPGVIHTQFTLLGPFTLDVLEVDLTNPFITFETYKSTDRLTKTTAQSAANDKAGHRVIAAINADFFSFETGWPINNQVVNGKPVLGRSTIKSQFVFTKERKVYIDGFSFTGKIFAKNGTNETIQEVNYKRDTNEMVLFTSFKDSRTGTDETGSECILNLLSKEWIMNDTLVFTVIQKQSGNSEIPQNGAVLSGGGTAAAYLDSNISINDTIKLFLAYNPRTSETSVRNITQVISGNGRLIKSGIPYPSIGDYDQSGTKFNETRHPRTFIGQNSDSTKIFLCTVDGRQSTSLGMNFSEMANFLLSIGVTNAFNLDGGGSTTMVVRGEIVNSPSDSGGERSVANTLQVISTGPIDSLHFLK